MIQPRIRNLSEFPELKKTIQFYDLTYENQRLTAKIEIIDEETIELLEVFDQKSLKTAYTKEDLKCWGDIIHFVEEAASELMWDYKNPICAICHRNL